VFDVREPPSGTIFARRGLFRRWGEVAQIRNRGAPMGEVNPAPTSKRKTRRFAPTAGWSGDLPFSHSFFNLTSVAAGSHRNGTWAAARWRRREACTTQNARRVPTNGKAASSRRTPKISYA